MEAIKLQPIEDERFLNLLFNYPFFKVRKAWAGFPSPADEYFVPNIDLNKELIIHPTATFFFRATGDSMIGADIQSGDILVVDRAIEPVDNDIIIAVVNGEMVVKRIRYKGEDLYLVSENERYRPVKVTSELPFEIWGTVLYVVRAARNKHRTGGRK